MNIYTYRLITQTHTDGPYHPVYHLSIVLFGGFIVYLVFYHYYRDGGGEHCKTVLTLETYFRGAQVC